MLDIYTKGLLLGLAMILPIGPQNAFVISQGIRQQYHLMVASICFTSDSLLIILGVFGTGALLEQSTLLLQLITLLGAIFLVWYGWNAFKVAWLAAAEKINRCAEQKSRWQIVLILLAVTWLNPHVYLDTVVVLGGIGSQLVDQQRQWFVLGAISASFIWFFTLAITAEKLSYWLQTVWAQRIINVFIGTTMWFIAGQLIHYLLINLL